MTVPVFSCDIWYSYACMLCVCIKMCDWSILVVEYLILIIKQTVLLALKTSNLAPIHIKCPCSFAHVLQDLLRSVCSTVFARVYLWSIISSHWCYSCVCKVNNGLQHVSLDNHLKHSSMHSLFTMSWSTILVCHYSILAQWRIYDQSWFPKSPSLDVLYSSCSGRPLSSQMSGV